MWGDNSSTCGGITVQYTVGDTFSTVEVVQYSGGITSVQWGIASVLWRDNISTVEGIQYIGGITSVQVGG